MVLLAVTLSTVSTVMAISPALADNPPQTESFKAHVALPFDEEGVHAGAAYKIRVPANWNGTLIVYAHGLYAQMSPYGYPVLVIPPLGMIAPGAQGGPNTEEDLIAAGFALAGSSYSANGWAVKEGFQDTLALTTYFNGRVGKPKHTILWGFSMGGTIALEIIEKSAGIFDGIIVEGSNGVGATQMFDGFMNIRVAYAVIFGFPEAWGTVADLRDDIEFGQDVWPRLSDDLFPPDPDFNFADAEFFRLLLGMPQSSFYPMKWGTLMWFVTMVGANLEQRGGGNPLQNLDAPPFTLTPAQIAYLNSLGVSTASIEAKLAQMNAWKIDASPSARNYLTHYATPTGSIKLPLIQVHSIFDGMNRVSGTGVYKGTVESAGRSELFLQAYAGDGTGHGTLTKAQYMQTIAAMQEWLETGERPEPLDYFTPAYGFVPGYVPPPWPQTQ